MPKLILDDEDLVLIKDLLKKWVPNALVMAYGSRVKGTCHGGSDLDLVVKNKLNPEQPTIETTDLQQAFSDSNIPILIDVMDWAYLPQVYREEINTINVIIQE